HPFNQDQYLDIVRYWASQLEVSLDDDRWRKEALRYALHRGSRSGRVARQFVGHWACS
ncbi:MAG TPA: DUF815 domain-containing protein, partial [Gammaproteobacteria bacterium]|nr:DUF815 domain-containing protein [Gammaproteobacteria bacterium]